jgi:hypothetical protein
VESSGWLFDASQNVGCGIVHYKVLSLGASNMLDVILVAAAAVFFALSVGYVVACDRL